MANASRGRNNPPKPASKSVGTLQRPLNLSPEITSAPPVLEQSEWSGEGEEAGGKNSTQGENLRMPKSSSSRKEYTPGIFRPLRQLSKKTLKLLASFRLAIGELVLIAVLCVPGTLIEQFQREEYYLQNFNGDHLAFGFLSGEWVLRLCLDHVYTAPYFLGLLALLATSLIACTSTRQVPLVKVARRWSFYKSKGAISKLDVSDTLPRASLDDLGALLMAERYQVFVRGPFLYAFKGLAGRFAPIGVHAALLLIMVGATYSASGGYRGSIMVPQGLSFTIGDIVNSNGVLSRPVPTFDTEVHVNQFLIDTYPNGQVSQFHSDLSLFDTTGKEVSRKTISVNDPLRFGGFTLYQTDWGISVFQVHIDGAGPFNLVAAPLQTGDNKLFGAFLPLGDNGLAEAKGISMLARELHSVVIYDSHGTFVGVRRPGSDRPITVDGVEIVVDDVIGSTGLEIKLDPGVPMVYAGFGALMLTTVTSYLSHSQVWALQEGTSIIVGGRTNRWKDDFKREFNYFLDLVPEIITRNNMAETTTVSMDVDKTERTS